jgi:hypothetical protein
MGPMDVQRTPHRLDRLTSQARYVRGHFSRRAMHASGDSPWHSSAKHHILEACFFRMTPFRSMLLTLQSGLQRLTPRAQSVPAYAQVLRHSSIVLSRRTRMQWYNCRSLIWWRVCKISSGDAAPPQVVESQEIKARAARHIRGFLGDHAIRGHVKKDAAPSHASAVP